MKAVLFAVGASVVVGQATVCNQLPSTNCSGLPACEKRTSGNTCSFLTDATLNITSPCNTDSKTQCGLGCTLPANPTAASIKSFKTCSTCTNTVCATLSASNETCIASIGCKFAAGGQDYCASTAVTPTPCSGATSATCIAEENCYWLSVQRTACDMNVETVNYCTACNRSDLTLHAIGYRNTFSALKNKKCTWAAADTSAGSDFSITVKAVDQNPSCEKLTASMFSSVTDIADRSKLGDAANNGLFGASALKASTSPKCQDAPSSALLVAPSLAIMGLVAVFLA